jgi:hypothetical protein
MDRNGKKSKATRAASNPERSDTKGATRDTLGRMADDARRQHERSGDPSVGSKDTRKGNRP